ncbi:MAG: hypothetical protein JRC91_07690 [Deltaproteobacteria bacterium]|nr:hypothetical protein [Deltaproteobacteria bacterium]
MNILPSERMLSLRQYFKTKDLGSPQFKAIQEGIYLCSNCDRCTVVCPAGINLKELWYDVREEFIRSGAVITPLVLSPFSYNRTYNRDDFTAPTIGTISVPRFLIYRPDMPKALSLPNTRKKAMQTMSCL